MSGRLPTPNQPLVYCDWSTLVDAFNGAKLAAATANRELHKTVLEAAGHGTLCFSLTHIWELLHWRNRVERAAMAAWLEDMPLVWFLSEDEVIKGEIRHAVVDAVNGRRTPPPLPVAPSFLRVFRDWDPVGKALSNALRNPTIPALVDEIGNDADSMRRLGEFRQISVDYAKGLYVDRTLALRARDEPALRAELEARLRAKLEADAVQAAEELKRNGVLASPTEAEVRKACGGFPDLTVVPYIFLSDGVTRNMSFGVTRRPNVRSRAFDEQRGDYYDTAHLVGAAYCDVFTCDAKVAQRLDGGRELLGKAAPITAQGGVVALHERLVEQLRAFETARRG